MNNFPYKSFMCVFIFIFILLLISIFEPSFKIGTLHGELLISSLTTILSSIVSTLGVIITIKYTKKQFDKDKRIQVKPHLNFLLESFSYESTLSDRIINRNQTLFNKINKDNIIIYLHGQNDDEDRSISNTIKIENIGIGPVINFKITSIQSNKREIDVIPNKIIFIDNIKIEGHIDLKLTIDTPSVSQEDNDPCSICEQILINIEYQDILYNKYEYKLYFETFISTVSTNLVTQSYQISSRILYDMCSEKQIKKA